MLNELHLITRSLLSDPSRITNEILSKLDFLKHMSRAVCSLVIDEKLDF
jgi:hypothetical protein